MAEPIVVVGAGGFGREVLDVVDAINSLGHEPVWHVVGVVDDDPSDENLHRLRDRGVDFLGGSDEPLKWLDAMNYAVGVGNPRVRRTLADKFDGAHFQAASLIHPSATLGFGVVVGDGAVICAGVRLTTNIRLGRHVHLNLNSTVGHDTTVGDFVSANPLASISGDCLIEDDVLIGVAGVVLNGVTIGQGSTVGGSACVVRDVPAGVVVKGVPAR
jgi:sugar O-acyltransferase (sialic acid O-acetyltransferase NeuD family)